MTKAQILIWLLIIALVFYYLTSENNPYQPKQDNWVIIKPKNLHPTKPTFPNSQVKPSQATKATFGLNPPPSQLNLQAEDKVTSIHLTTETTQAPKPSSTLTPEEQLQRKTQALSDYHWLLNNKTISDWHHEQKLTDTQFQVLRTLTDNEEMNTLKHFLTLLPANYEWLLISPDFKDPTLITHWKNLNFTLPQVQDWIKIGLNPTDYALTAWIRDHKKLTAEQTLNSANFAELKKEFSHGN